MMPRALKKGTAITLAATVSLVGCIVVAAVRLLQVDASLRVTMGQNFVWHVSQTQYLAALFGESLARVAAGDNPSVETESPALILIKLASRLDFLLDGPSRRALDGMVSLEDLAKAHRNLLAAEAAFQKGLSRDEALDLRAEVATLHQTLRDTTNRLLLQQRELNADTRDLYHHVVLESLAAVMGILVSSTVLLLRLFRGIRETRRAERLLRQEQELSDLVVNLSNQGIVIFDRNLRCLLWNPGMEALFQFTASEVVGRSLAGAPLFDHPVVSAAMAQAIRGESALVEDEGLSPNYPERCLEISFHPLRMAEQNLAIAFMRDVTERWLARRNAERQTVDLERKIK
jgi:PAS domain S-box-containing protein